MKTILTAAFGILLISGPAFAQNNPLQVLEDQRRAMEQQADAMRQEQMRQMHEQQMQQRQFNQQPPRY